MQHVSALTRMAACCAGANSIDPFAMLRAEVVSVPRGAHESRRGVRRRRQQEMAHLMDHRVGEHLRHVLFPLVRASQDSIVEDERQSAGLVHVAERCPHHRS